MNFHPEAQDTWSAEFVARDIGNLVINSSEGLLECFEKVHNRWMMEMFHPSSAGQSDFFLLKANNAARLGAFVQLIQHGTSSSPLTIDWARLFAQETLDNAG